MSRLTKPPEGEKNFDLTCPNCRYEFRTEAMKRPGPDTELICPKSCGRTFTFARFQNPGPPSQQEFFGPFVVCEGKVDRKGKLILCAHRYQIRMVGAGAHNSKKVTGGVFRACPECGARHKSVPLEGQATGEAEDDTWDASEVAGKK
jgi:hypothetical protein